METDRATEKSWGQQPREGKLTSKIESYTSRTPSMVYLGLAVGSIVLSGALAATRNKKSTATFVGLWAPTILLIGIYNKLVKLQGHDQESRDTVH